MVLELREITAGYPLRKDVVRDISLCVERGQIVVLMGHNGAGKTTLLNTIFGSIRPSSGRIVFHGKDITSDNIVSRVRGGMSYCPQGQGIFPGLCVIENLKLAGLGLDMTDGDFRPRLETIFGLFPRLRERGRQRAKTLSGGEQRMLSVGMAFIQHPSLLLLDEPSLGLSPLLTQELFRAVNEFGRSFGMSVLLVEQNVKFAIELAQCIYILKRGELAFSGRSDVLLEHDELWKNL